MRKSRRLPAVAIFAQAREHQYIPPTKPEGKRSMEDAQSVAEHYAHGSLEQAIFDALSVAGKDASRLAYTDLAPVDEFHIGGREATIDLAQQLPFGPGFHLLDIGCGLGGASRYFAQERGCMVTGIDLTEDYVRVAGVLAARMGLGDRVSYRRGSALALPFAPQSFDGAYMLHVGMNIGDKAALFAEIRRVLKTGSAFAIYDVMREIEGGELTFPLPWASRLDISFVDSAGTYRDLLEQAGFLVQVERSRRDFAIDVFLRMQARSAATGGPPPLGLHILMGASARQKVTNILNDLEAGLVAPTEMISQAA
jgi:ubiquinone/menaquinone biosynthesis C-methylase UbiE